MGTITPADLAEYGFKENFGFYSREIPDRTTYGRNKVDGEHLSCWLRDGIAYFDLECYQLKAESTADLATLAGFFGRVEFCGF